MKMNAAGVRLVKSFEGWRASAYRDAVGHWTIGYGHTSMAGPPKVHQGMHITRAEGSEILARDLQYFADEIQPLINVPLSDNQFSALVSFAYNVGVGNFRKSSVLKKVNAGQFDKAASRFVLWNKAGGRVLNGLTRRRLAEAALFANVARNVPSRAELKEIQHERSAVTHTVGTFAEFRTWLAGIFTKIWSLRASHSKSNQDLG